MNAERFGRLRSVEMASNRVLRGNLLAHGDLVRAERHRMRAARMKAAARWRIEGARHFAADGQLFVSLVGMRRQSRGEQGLGIGMQRLGAQLEAVGELDDLSEIHDRDPMTDIWPMNR